MPQRDTNPTRPTQQSDFNGSDALKDEASTALKAGLSEGVRDLSSEVQHVAADVADEARKVAESKIRAGKDQAAEHLGAVASALRQTTARLRSEDNALTDYVEKAASSVDGLSHYLQTRTLSQLVGDAEDFARREPAIFLGGAFFAGLVGGRFLKSATPRAGMTPDASPGSAARRKVEPARSAATPQLGMGSSTPTSGATTASTASKPAAPTSTASTGTGAAGSMHTKEGTPKTPEAPRKPTTNGNDSRGG